MPSAPCPENPRFHPPSSHSSVADPSPWVVAALSPARLGQAVREVPSSRFALDGRGACLEGSRCDAGPSPRTAGGPSTSSKTSAPRYTTPCSGSIAATQDRDTTLDTVQLLSAPVSRRTVRAPDRRRVDVSTSAPGRQVYQRDVETRPQPQPTQPGQLRSCSADGPAAIRRRTRPYRAVQTRPQPQPTQPGQLRSCSADGPAAIRRRTRPYRAVHDLVSCRNSSTRVRPVAPSTRTAYCRPFGLRRKIVPLVAVAG